MGIVIFLSLNASPSSSRSEKPYNMYLAIGYTVPMVITLLTLTAELTMDTCALGRPKFGMETCFFAGTYLAPVAFEIHLVLIKEIKLDHNCN